MRSIRAVNEHDYTALFTALNEAVDILDRNRLPEPAFVAAYDTLRQSRAMLAKVLQPAEEVRAATSDDLAAA